MKHVLIPHQIEEKFSLTEAVEWIAFKGVPTDLDLGYVDENMFGMSRTVFAEQEYGLPKEACAIPEGVDNANAAAEPAQAQLFLALRSGDLKAYGVTQTAHTEWFTSHPYEISRYMDVQTQTEEMLDAKSQVIPPELWRLEKIDWLECALTAGGERLFCIWIKRDDLFQCFPPQETQAPPVHGVAGFLTLPSDEGVGKPVMRSTSRGRPPKIDWTAFFVEVSRHVQGDSLPQKQEAFILMMQEWCNEKYAVIPSRSTLLEKISPFYAAFVRK